MSLRIVRIVAIALVLALAVGGVLAWRAYTQPLPLPQSPYAFEVRSGSSLSTVARELASAGVLPHAWVLVALARLRGVDRAIKAGSYEIEPGIRLPQLLAKLTEGDVTQKAFTIGEGTTVADLRRALRANPDLRSTVVDVPDAALLARLGVAGTTPEGRFFPDTYFFAVGSTDAALLQRAARARSTSGCSRRGASARRTCRWPRPTKR